MLLGWRLLEQLKAFTASVQVKHSAFAGARCIESELGLHASGVARRRGLPAFAAFGNFCLRHVQLEHQFMRIDGDAVALVNKCDGATSGIPASAA